MDTTPYWSRTAHLRTFPPVSSDLSVDVVVAGAGITGITAAYLLKLAGKRVALVERGRCAGADTGHTTAHLTCVLDTSLTDLVTRFGEDHATAAWDAGLAAIAEIDEIAQREEISCGFAWVSGYWHLPQRGDEDPDAREDLKKEAALADRLGFDATFEASAPGVNRPAMRVANQARFHPRQYLAGLLSRIDGDGSFVFEGSDVDEVLDAPRHVVANGFSIGCDHVIIATHNPLAGRTGALTAALQQTRLSLFTSYVVGGRVSAGGWPDGLFWDTSAPYQYIRSEPHGDWDYVIVGGADHKTGQQSDTTRVYAQLEEDACAAVPGLAIEHRWSGQVIETPDGLPLIGETSPGQFVATGFAGNGMTFGTLAGMMARDHVIRRQNPWAQLFAANRAALAGGLWDYLKQNADYPYYMIRDRFAGTSGRSSRAVPPGMGRVIDHHGASVAAYRNRKGVLTLRSAVCPHLGCIVHWNDAEQTWDCPCHGSRFTTTGEVLAGPAESPLAPIESPR